MTAPYADAAWEYRRAGWSPIPLPPRAKTEPPKGWTGAAAPYPSGADIQAWIEERPDSNVCLRLPADILGIDVDNYGAKRGGETLHNLVRRYGPLPPTWRSTSRGTDGVSGIYFFRVPEGLLWPNVAGPDIEIIRKGHRYAVVWPSIHPDTGGTYQWYDHTDGLVLPPAVDDLPDLTDTWIGGLTGGQLAEDTPRANLDTAQVTEWLSAGDGAPCQAMAAVIATARERLEGHERARHEVALAATARAVRLHGQGHPGAVTVLAQLRGEWLRALGADRSTRDADSEWVRLLAGAVRIAAAEHPTRDQVDPCAWEQALTAAPTPPASGDPPAPQQDTSDAQATPVPGGPPWALQDAQAAPTTDPGEDTAAATPTWRPAALAPFLTGRATVATPTLMPRTDGICLLYPGLTHSLHGESESGKSWIAQHETARLLKDRRHCLYLDFESDPASIVDRMLTLGVPPANVVAYLVYSRPETAPKTPAELDAFRALLTGRYALAVIDGVTNSMSIFGHSINDNDDIATWQRILPDQIARRTGAAVLAIDHVVKDTETRGRFAIGGQAKMAGITGAAYTVDVKEVLGKGLRGELSIRVGKDRPGGVRGHAGPARKSDRTQEIARFIFDSTGDRPVAEITPPAIVEDDGKGGNGFMPTQLMERMSVFIEAHPGVTRTAAVNAVNGRREWRARALEELIECGSVRVERTGNGHWHYSVWPFREDRTAGDVLRE